MSDYSNTHWMKDAPDLFRKCIESPIAKINYFDDSECFPKVWIDAPKYNGVLWNISQDLVYQTLSCLEAGLENTQSALIEHDSSLGRTTTKNRMWAETLEKEIEDMKDCIKQLKMVGINHTTHCP